MVDAALTLPDGSIHIFDGPNVIPARLAESGFVPQGVPLPLDALWQLMPFERVDAAFVSGERRAYFFAGDQYCIHDARTRERIEGPRPIRDHWNVDNWERLPEAWDRDYSAVAFWTGNGKAWFFKGTEYLRYDLSADRVDTSVDGQWVYPLPITRHWKLPYPSLDAFTVDAGDRGLAFSGSDWVEYDVGRHEALRSGRLTWGGPEVSGPELIPRLPSLEDLTRWTDQPVIDRSRLAPWRPLIDHRLERDEPPTNNYFVMIREAFPQELNEGAGPVSLDCYGVVVDRWPLKQDGSTRYTLEEATQHIRTRLNLMTFGVSSGIEFGGFAPFDEDVDGPVWSSTTSLGRQALLSRSMKTGDGELVGAHGVVASAPESWTFKTFHTSKHGEHVLCEIRRFGDITPPGATSTCWGTRGVARLAKTSSEAVPPVIPYQRLQWRVFARNLLLWVNGNDGAATLLEPTELVHDWSELQPH